jgi:hypothetical protein
MNVKRGLSEGSQQVRRGGNEKILGGKGLKYSACIPLKIA